MVGRTHGTTMQANDASKRQPERSNNAARFAVNPLIVFAVLAVLHLLAALKAPIQDCDETFNYWEPTHYLTNGKGFQTWEYSPRYAIRSWTYAGLHALPIAFIQAILPGITKPSLFSSMRIMLGMICAICETKLYSAIRKTFNERIAIMFWFILSTSPGMFHASVAYLPSSFAMYSAMLGAAFFMDWSGSNGSVNGILSFGIGAILGWPFAAALILPFLTEEAVLALRRGREVQLSLLKRWSYGVLRCLIVLAVQIAIDSAFYRKLLVVPLNIVLYNVFSSKGPDLYGTEPWHFYARNLTLNFHVWFLLAIIALPLMCIRQLSWSASGPRSSRGFYLLTPLYLWLVIFTLQPHKEERFMYPAYPFVALNAAYAFHHILAWIGDTRSHALLARVPVQLRLAVILAFIFTALLTSVLRIAATWSAFAAPLTLYQPLSTVTNTTTVCLGKEWYRFPTHYLLPDEVTARFVRSEFRGLLPGHFQPTDSKYPFSATWIDPDGMNDDNIEDLGKYVELSECDYLVDSHLPSTAVTTFEPDYIHDTAQWQKVVCKPFLDAVSTGVVGRLLWTPDFAMVPSKLRRIWGEYCLLKRLPAK